MPKGKPLESVLARALDAWLNGDEGRRCLRADTLSHDWTHLDVYLANRLQAAFAAGWDAAKADQTEGDSGAGRVRS